MCILAHQWSRPACARDPPAVLLAAPVLRTLRNAETEGDLGTPRMCKHTSQVSCECMNLRAGLCATVRWRHYLAVAAAANCTLAKTEPASIMEHDRQDGRADYQEHLCMRQSLHIPAVHCRGNMSRLSDNIRDKQARRHFRRGSRPPSSSMRMSKLTVRRRYMQVMAGRDRL